jgi:hypothetical protein
MTARVLTTCFELLSQVVRGGGVLCWLRLFVFGGVRVVVFASAFYVTIAVLLLLFFIFY